MAGKRDKPEDIVLKLRHLEVLQGQGMAISDVPRPGFETALCAGHAAILNPVAASVSRPD